MTHWRFWLADALLRHAASVMPAQRAEWARAMLAEAEHLPPGERLGFAGGCVWSSYRERVMDAKTVLGIGRWGIGLGLCAGTMICFRTAFQLREEPVFAMILILGFICLAAVAAYARWGLGRLPVIAIAGLAAGVAAVLAAGDPAAMVAGSPFYRAILLEQVVAWAALLVLARFMLNLNQRQRAND